MRLVRDHVNRRESMRLLTMLFALALATTGSALAATEYEIQAAVNDEKFVIDGERYEAKTYCLEWEQGDQVLFVEGTPGACVSAVLFNKRRRQRCEVWC
jgi:hypothetical protein